MRRKNKRFTDDADRVVKDIKRQTRRRFSAEDTISIVLAGLMRQSNLFFTAANVGSAFW